MLPNALSFSFFQGDGVAGTSGHSDEIDCQVSSAAPEISTCTSASSENWMVLSIAGDKPTPRSCVCNFMILLHFMIVMLWKCREQLWQKTELLFAVISMQQLSLRIR